MRDVSEISEGYWRGEESCVSFVCISGRFGGGGVMIIISGIWEIS